MKFSYGCNDLKDKLRAEENVFLLTNGLGGYSSLTLANSLTRNDHALLMAAIKAPDIRINMVSRLDEEIIIDGKYFNLSSQKFVDYSKNLDGEKYLINVTQEYIIAFTYLVEGIEITKEIVLAHGENTVGIKYSIYNPAKKTVTLHVTPYYQFVERGSLLQTFQEFSISDNKVESNGMALFITTTATDVLENDLEFVRDLYFNYDARDGRFAYGCAAKKLTYCYDISDSTEVDLIFSTQNTNTNVTSLIKDEYYRLEKLFRISNATSDLAKTLVRASDAYVVQRESVDGLTLIAGYPFFLDWGRDTMYTIEGACIATNRFEQSENILQTFVKYLHNGIMPNLFPEGDNPPLYNTVDASLLFIQAVYLHYKKSDDIEFVKRMYPAIVEIIDSYKNGTDFDIKMDTDGLITAGSGLMQLTWMDVRYENILPTPRHGKPVEINAYWYSGLCILEKLGNLIGEPVAEYTALIETTKINFVNKFYNASKKCLKDVVSGNDYDNQIRCNQIWAVSVPFSPLPDHIAEEVVTCVYEKLYTPYGLRTLAVEDAEFVAEYSGNLKKRDLSYHQGTVWPFPLGSYFRAYLKVNHYSDAAVKLVTKQIDHFADCLREGCVGQIAEIYDGMFPAISRGCFAQGWSVCEILKIVLELNI
ncbi:amylo-alpha-1,6-glucosidase [Candidatus Epulonipiscium viviparus]|uniref:amylo-alpha-1,6-glucosidase n=1 Tax=Candidatus Epulonipiscium viviparus TaxID=420336 RepID=UPI00049743CC|nr:amylo-alpha-1,6-glucosidase [Candidatus Epulopiscium viviparus]